MITLLRTSIFMPGKVAEARAWSAEAAERVAHITGNKVRVGAPVGGNVNGVVFISQYDSLAAFEEQTAKIAGSVDFTNFLKRAEGLFVPGSLTDQLYRTN
jgi:NIPSNAP